MKKLLLLAGLVSCTTNFIPNPPGPPPPPPPVLPPPPPPPIVVPPAPAKMEMAINESANDYWSVGRWNDASRTFSGWFFWDSTGTGKQGSVSGYSATGYPKSDAQCISFMNDYPAGVYTLTWQGKGTFSIPWAKSFVVTGPNSAAVTLNANSQIYLRVTGLDAAQPLNGVHLWMPGTGPSSPMYRPEYTGNLKSVPIVSVRTMPNQSHATDKDVNWSDRVTMDMWSWTDKAPPYEVEIELAKAAGLKRLWINVPIQATDDYLLQMANLFHSQLPAGIELMVEYSNECWNWGGSYACWPYINKEANTTNIALYDGKIVNGVVVPDVPGVWVTDSYTRAARAAAEKAYHVAQIFHAVYKDRPQDMNMILAGQAAWNAWTMAGLEWIAAKYGAPKQWFKYSAIAPYFDPNWNNGQYKPATGWKTVSDLLTAAGKMIANDIPGQIDSHKMVANKYGLDLIDYEGGQSFFNVVNPYSATDLATLAQRDPGMGVLNAQYFAVLLAHGVNIHFEFAYVSEPFSKSGYWDILQSLGDTVNNPRWQSLIDYTKH